MQLRVLVYNVRGFRSGADQVAAAVAKHAPDLAMVQECGSRRRLRKFARTMEMEAVSTRLWPLLRQVRNAVLVRPPWRVVSFRLHRFERSAPFHPRGALIAVVGRAGYRVSALSAHLGLIPGERIRHAHELTDLVRAIDHPVLIGGDLNEGADERAASWIADRFWDAFSKAGSGPGETFPSADPTARIDYLFASEQFGITRAIVLDTAGTRAASDHLPLLVDLELD
jgi:endonuclease/exonuclease/phosphatase family metal-dependent hydrolase